MKSKLICWLLACLMLLSAFCVTACSDPEDDPVTDPDTSEDPAITDPKEEEKDEKILPNLPAKSFGGEEFHCLHWNLDSVVGGGWVPWEEIHIDEPTGETLDDQVYRRNAFVEETYEVVISTEYCMAHTEMPVKIRAAVSTNDDTYQIMVQRSGNLSGMWTDGLFYNLRGDEMAHIDFEKPWWNKNSLDTFTFGEVTQFASSEMLILDKSETGCIFFSTVLQNDHNLPNYYQIGRASCRERV